MRARPVWATYQTSEIAVARRVPQSRQVPAPEASSGSSVQRRQDILDLVIANRHVEVAEISRLFGVSRVTVRADLEFLG